MLAASILLTPLPAPGQEASRDTLRGEHRVTVDDALALRRVSEVRASPDGQWIAYVVTEREVVPEEDRYVYDANVWLASADGREPVQLTRDPGRDENPRWAPDGSWLAFLSDRGDTTQVFGIRPDGGEPWPVTDWPTGVNAFRLSPDGRRIAFTARPETPDPDRELEERRGRPIVMDSAYADQYVHLWTAALEHGSGPGDPPRAAEVRRSSPADLHVQSFAWGPDSRALAWSARPRPRLRTFLEADVWVQDTAGAEPRRVVSLPGGDNVAGWPREPGLLTTGSGHDLGTHNGEIWLADASGRSEPVPLTEALDHDAGYVDATAEHLLVEAPIRTGRGLFRIPLREGRAAGQPTRVDDGGLVYRGFSTGDDGTLLAFVAEGPRTPPDVHVSPASEFSPTRLTQVNPQARDFALGEQRVIRWRSHAGGEIIEGVLTLPVGHEEGERVPLLVDVHGGPAGVDVNDYKAGGYAYPTQVFAGLGYAVLQPNYRGSTGYGERFRGLNRGHISGSDWVDVRSGVDHVIETGIADPKRLGLMGWSFGGHHTYWGITRTDRFAAASAGAGANDLVSMYSQTDIPEFYHTYLGPKPWEDFELYEERSAYRYVENVTTPLLIQVGEEDERVPAEQSIQFYEAVKAIGKVPEVKLVIYPDQGHGIREPRLQRDLMSRNVSWFAGWIPTAESREAGYPVKRRDVEQEGRR